VRSEHAGCVPQTLIFMLSTWGVNFCIQVYDHLLFLHKRQELHWLVSR
jgi:hypothetical protein